ncbi:hypothetical protein VN97_g183 [Penicillium thymicola]|uniref:Uncharacterized protein n=1 Tax=Penicillium thymicola TaxID=293382 RepID=A0AAI9XEW2_PENTH|nr:hypothetical protein VN97_g183 [Penicillium thymicola]
MKLSNGSLPGVEASHTIFSTISKPPTIHIANLIDSTALSIFIDPHRTNSTVQIAIHPYVRIQVLYLLKGSVMVIQVFIFSAGKYSGKFRHQYY